MGKSWVLVVGDYRVIMVRGESGRDSNAAVEKVWSKCGSYI